MSPDVMAQQLPQSLASYAPSAGQASGAPAQPDPMAFANTQLDDMAKSLTNVAQVVGQVRPELMPLIQKIAQAASMLQNEIQSNGKPGETPAAPAQPEGPGDVGLS